MNGKRVNFTGTGGQLFGLILVHFILLTILTLGLYWPWAMCRFFRWRAQHTLVGNRTSQFTGSGIGFLLFCLVHLLILPLLTLGLYYFYGLYRVYAWREQHTRYGGERTSFGAKFGGFLGIMLISWILNSITLGLFSPWAFCMFYKWQTSGLAVGEQVEHFPPVKANLLILLILILLGLLPFVAIYLLWPQLKQQYQTQLQAVSKYADIAKMKPSDLARGRFARPPSKIRPRVTPPRPKVQPAPRREPKPTVSPPPRVTQVKKPEKKVSKNDKEISRLTEILKKDPDNIEALYNRAWLYGERGDLELAETDYNRAIKIGKDNKSAYYNRGLLYVEMRKYDAAVRDFSKAIRLDSRFIDAYCNRGNVYYQLGKTALAIRDYTKALDIKPNDADIRYNRGLAYLSLKQREKAMADFKKAARLGHKQAKEHLKGIDKGEATKPSSAPPGGRPAAWKKDLSNAKIPESGAAGMINGDRFVSTSAKMEHGILTIRDGKDFFPDHAVMIFLFLKKGEKPDGKSYEIKISSGFGSPHIHMKWKPADSKVPKTSMFMKGYAMRLQFGKTRNGELPGRIYLCLPDKKWSYVAGSFRAFVK
jgi:tetratricopeptide (TPR) repeat protein